MSDVYMEALQAHNEQRFDDAEQLYRQSLVLADQTSNGPMIALTMHQLGRLSFEQGDLHRAMRRFKKLLHWQNGHNDSRGQSRTCRQIAAILDYRGDSLEALQWGNKALSFAESVWSRHNMAEARMLLGLLCFRERRITDAITNMRTAQEIWEELKDDDGFYRVSYRLAQIFIRHEDVPAAIREYRRCLDILQHDELEEAADIHQQIALLSVDVGLFGEAITHSLAALGRNRKLQAVELHDNVGVLLRLEDVLGENAFWGHVSKHLDETGLRVVRSIIDTHRSSWDAIEIDAPSQSSEVSEPEVTVEMQLEKTVVPAAIEESVAVSEDDSAERVPEPVRIQESSEEVTVKVDLPLTNQPLTTASKNVDQVPQSTLPAFDEQTDEIHRVSRPSKVQESTKTQTPVPMSSAVSVNLPYEEDSSPSIDSDIPDYITENPIIYAEEDDFSEEPQFNPIPLQSDASQAFVQQFFLTVVGAFVFAITVLFSMAWLWRQIFN